NRFLSAVQVGVTVAGFFSAAYGASTISPAVAPALAVGPPLDRFASIMRPVIWLLSSSTNVVVRLLGGDPRATGEQMTEQELRDLVITNQSLPADERKILGDVFDATEHTLGEVMRPRHDVVFLRADLDLDDAIREIVQQPYS